MAITPEITSKKVSRDVIDLLVRAHCESILGNRMPAYDGRKSLFTAGPLPFEIKEFKVKLGDNDELRSSATFTSSFFFFFVVIIIIINNCYYLNVNVFLIFH